MSIFDEMWPRRTFSTRREYTELQRMLGEAISRGYIEEIPVARPGRAWLGERWFREIAIGAMYSLTEPGEKWPYWSPVEFEDSTKGNEGIQ